MGKSSKSVEMQTSILYKIDSYYIIIEKENLRHFLNRGIIYPICYENNDIFLRENRKKDIFDKCPGAIPIVKKMVKPEDEEALIEIDANLDFPDNLTEIGTDIILYPYPLPISRIKRIYFPNEKLKSEFRDQPLIKVKLPDSYLDKIPSGAVYLDEVDFTPANEFNKSDEVTKQLHAFNGRLGAALFIKNSGFFHSNITEEYSEYSRDFIQLIVHLSGLYESFDKAGNKLNFSYKEFEKNNKIFDVIIDLLNNQKINEEKGLSWMGILTHLFNKYLSTDEELTDLVNFLEELRGFKIKDEEKFSILNQKIVEYKDNLISLKDLVNLDLLDSADFRSFRYAIIIHQYCRKKMEDQEQSRNVLLREENPIIEPSKLILHLLLLGYYYGYERLKSEEHREKEKGIDPEYLVDNPSLKITLKDPIEIFAMETVFRFVFINKFKREKPTILNDRIFRPEYLKEEVKELTSFVDSDEIYFLKVYQVKILGGQFYWIKKESYRTKLIHDLEVEFGRMKYPEILTEQFFVTWWFYNYLRDEINITVNFLKDLKKSPEFKIKFELRRIHVQKVILESKDAPIVRLKMLFE